MCGTTNAKNNSKIAKLFNIFKYLIYENCCCFLLGGGAKPVA